MLQTNCSATDDLKDEEGVYPRWYLESTICLLLMMIMRKSGYPLWRDARCVLDIALLGQQHSKLPEKSLQLMFLAIKSQGNFIFFYWKRSVENKINRKKWK